MHQNPVRGKWNLVTDFALYLHSSAGFYFGTNANVYKWITRVEDAKVELAQKSQGLVTRQLHMAVREVPGGR